MIDREARVRRLMYYSLAFLAILALIGLLDHVGKADWDAQREICAQYSNKEY